MKPPFTMKDICDDGGYLLSPSFVLERINSRVSRLLEATKLSHECHGSLFHTHWGDIGRKPEEDLNYVRVEEELKEWE